MATRTVPFCLEMLTFGPPRELRRTLDRRGRCGWTRGEPMATRTMPFCLEMLTFGPPRKLRHTPVRPDAERAYGHSHIAFLLGNAYIWPPRELWRTFRVRLDAGRAYGHSHSAFLLGNAYIWPPRELRGTRVTPRRGEGLLLLSQCLYAWKELGNTSQRPRRELLERSRNSSTR